MSIQTNVYGVHDEEVGTLVLTLSDPVAEVSEVRFYVTDGSGVRSGPFEADRQSPDLPPGIYEKDVQPDIANETMIEAELLLGNGSIQNIGSESFPRTSGILVTLKQEDVTERGASIEIGTGLRLTRSVDLRRPRLEASDIMLSLLNFRDAERTSTGVVYRWARGSSVAEIHVYDMVYTQPVPADPWSSHGAPTAILRMNDEYSAAIPPVGAVRYLQFEPRDARMTAGPVQRAILTGLPEARPTLEQIRQLPGSAPSKANLAVLVTDPRNRGGTLYAWLNRLSPESADPNVAADGVLVLGAPGMVTSGNVWALTGGGTAQLFDEITVHAGRGKRIYLEYVTADGVSTGKVNVELIGGAVAIDPDTGEITDGSIDIAKFAQGIEPVTIHEGTDLPMLKSTSAILWNGTLYRWDGQAYSSAVPAADITGQIDTSQIADAAVSAEKLGTGAVQTANLAIAAVTADILAASAVDSTHIHDGAIDTPKLAAGAVTTGKLAAGAVTANEIAADAIQAANIAAGAITTAKLDAGAVTAAKIGALAITSDKLAVNTVVAGKIATGAVTAGTIDANAVTAGTIAAGAVSTNELDTGAVTAEKIAVGAVTADRISVDRLSALNEDVGQVTAGYLRNVAGTAGISLSVGPPSGWTRYIDLSGAGEYFLHTQDVWIDHGGNATFSGELSAATGTFAGDISAATGTFSGTVAASEFTSMEASFSSLIKATGREPTLHQDGGAILRNLWWSPYGNASGNTTWQAYAPASGGTLNFNVITGNDIYFSTDGKVHSHGFVTYSPTPPKPASSMTASDWLAWALADAAKPVYPHGVPSVDNPAVQELVTDGRSTEAVVADLDEAYAKDLGTIAIGAARWAGALHQALKDASDFASFRAAVFTELRTAE